MRFHGVRRGSMSTSFIMTLGRRFGFEIQEEECKMLCLMVGVCQSVQYTYLTPSVGLCRGFTDRGHLSDLRPMAGTNLYWKLNCANPIQVDRPSFINVLGTTARPQIAQNIRGKTWTSCQILHVLLLPQITLYPHIAIFRTNSGLGIINSIINQICRNYLSLYIPYAHVLLCPMVYQPHTFAPPISS